MTVVHPATKQKSRDVRKLLAAFKTPRRTNAGEAMLVSAHRGLRWNGAVENTLEAVRRAAEAGLPSVEIDIRTTADGVVGIDRYDPVTGKGFNPLVADLTWSQLEELSLRDQNGNITHERVMTLADLLSGIRAAHIDILVFLDFKDAASIAASYDVVRQYSNAAGVPAIEWCVWKTALEFVPHPDALESESWYTEAWSERSYVVAFEVGQRSPNGPLLPLVRFARERGISLGFFGALGDIEDDPGCPADRLVHWEHHGMVTYDQILKPALFKSLGYSWIIADRTREVEPFFEAAAKIMMATGP